MWMMMLMMLAIVMTMMVVVMMMTCLYVLFAINQQQEIKQSHDVDDHGDDAVEQVCAICHQPAAGDQAES